MAERLEEWGRKLMDDQGGIQAKAQKALDLAEDAHRKMNEMSQGQARSPFTEVAAERPEELKGTLTSRSMPKTVAAVFDELHGCLEEWVSAIEGRIYSIEQVIWSAVSFVDGTTSSPSGSKPSNCRVIAAGGATATATTALRKLEGDVDIIRKVSAERKDEVHHMEASFRSEIDEIQLSNKDCNQRLDHVELDMVHIKDEIKAQATEIQRVQRDNQATFEEVVTTLDALARHAFVDQGEV